MPGLAADLCKREFRIFHAAWPLTGRMTTASLQPLVNLTRLTHRAGDSGSAYQALHALNHAVHHSGGALIHGTPISFDHFVATSADRREAAVWLRALLLEDGTRLLAVTGQWTRAAAHAAMYDDASERLYEARQTRIVAQLHEGHTEAALTLLETSVTTEPWEQAVAAYLHSYSDLRTHRLTAEGVATTLAAVRHARQSVDRNTTLFRLRLALITVDLAAEMSPGPAEALCGELIRDAAESEDAVAARVVLRHEAARAQMTPTGTQALETLVLKAGLDRGAIPAPLLTDLMASVEIAETVLARTLVVPPSD